MSDPRPVDFLPQLITWATFNIFAACGLVPLLLVTLYLQGLDANATLVNLEFIFILTSSSASALVWTGHALDPDPPFGLCLWNASAVMANTPLMAGAALAIVTKVWGTTMSIWHPRWRPVMSWITWTPFLISIPFFFGCPLLFTAVGLGLKNRDLVHRGSPFYCLLDVDSLQILSSAFGAILTFTSLVLAAWTSVKLVRMRRRIGSVPFSGEDSNGISYAFVLRVIFFSLFVGAAFVSGIIALNSSFDAVIPDIVVASCGVGAFSIFASSKAIVRFVFFCRRHPSTSTSYTSQASRTISGSARSNIKAGPGSRGRSAPGVSTLGPGEFVLSVLNTDGSPSSSTRSGDHSESLKMETQIA
ncbi:hypothetical protein FB45DRAFT_44927 [Roridomyces roridus]|uniref:Uncharacterized protein n=1 Tax=Roridomyces roridus TaxID=1738132 RepID=A0AAD7BRP6_9AGAR|nr:hypothetical protein FB45DRAFT_44927 [Roridomyces roridus]